jgi:membrane protease subunit (stomatin/prohibitin family)
MDRFITACPACGKAVEKGKLAFAGRSFRCACGLRFDLRGRAIESVACPGCGRTVAFDAGRHIGTVCPACAAQLFPSDCERASSDAAKAKRPNPSTAHQSEVAHAAVRFGGDADDVVWKHPVALLGEGVRVVVRPGEEALSFPSGCGAVQLTAGEYTLAQLTGRDGGPAIPCEVYFVNMGTFANIAWGTAPRVSFTDALSGVSVRLGAYGVYSIRIFDSMRFFQTLGFVGDTVKRAALFGDDARAGMFHDVVMGKARSLMARAIVERMVDILRVAAYLDEIAEEVRDLVNEEIIDHGLQLVSFSIVSASVEETEEIKALRARKRQ